MPILGKMVINLSDFRKELSRLGVDAFVCFSDDSHASESPCDHDDRRKELTGFTGSAGTALVSMDQAWLWTDGRYFVQAEAELASEWTLMKGGLPDTKTIKDVIKNTESITKVGFDMLCSPFQEVQDLKTHTQKALVATNNPVDALWPDRPLAPCGPISLLPKEFSGQDTASKLAAVRSKMAEEGLTHVVVLSLDEVCWTCNIRGADNPNTPFARGFLIVGLKYAELYVVESRLTEEALAALDSAGVTRRDYFDFAEGLKGIPKTATVMVSRSAACVIEAIPEANRKLVDANIVANLKAVKNQTELQGFQSCHVEDAVAMCRYLSWVTTASDDVLASFTEFTAALRLEGLRREMPSNRGLSFTSISSIGGNGAVIHYHPTEKESSQMQRDLYLIDSGGQYLTGTTDITRTMHLGEPSAEQKEMFTRVLCGHIDLALTRFPRGTKGFQLDTLARRHLWNVNRNYLHGTGE
ncbi:MAG: hypothetical protein KVP17_000249 [Porospora cf. gigantea B]|uniref:uncharacterized protein n=2 Tax=Porospora cf. gigantea B TaxID=2853592 RepID=UPI0035719B21|nr:MAG: hypothetical protein KVP17_000249 [Porospora cf. gigantea B]